MHYPNLRHGPTILWAPEEGAMSTAERTTVPLGTGDRLTVRVCEPPFPGGGRTRPLSETPTHGPHPQQFEMSRKLIFAIH